MADPDATRVHRSHREGPAGGSPATAFRCCSRNARDNRVQAADRQSGDRRDRGRWRRRDSKIARRARTDRHRRTRRRSGAAASLRNDAVFPRAIRVETSRGASTRRRARDRASCAAEGNSHIRTGHQGQRRRTSAGRLMPETMRIQRALARAGIASRRKAEELVAAGRVRINGAIAETGQSVDPARDTITVDGKTIGAPAALVWIVLNKPTGVLTTRADPGGRRTVFNLVDDGPGLTDVGRLDYMTEGVLLLTTDGDAAHKLTHPSSEIERTYVATVRGDGADAARAAMKGVELEDGLVMPKDVTARRGGRGIWELDVNIGASKKRE